MCADHMKCRAFLPNPGAAERLVLFQSGHDERGFTAVDNNVLNSMEAAEDTS